MGLGKTIQVLYFMEWYFQNGNAKPNLVIAPVSLLENWEQEHKKFFKNSNLDLKLLWGSNVRNYVHVNDKELTIKCLNNPGLYLTTYETLRRHQIPFAMVNWGIVALDEAQRVKTPGTLVTNAAKALKAQFKIAMTGTPVENSLVDLWCIMDFCNPGLLQDARTFTKEYVKPLKEINTDFEELSKVLRGKIGEALMRRMKFDVAKDLPDITPIENRVHEEKMPLEQYKAYVNELYSIEEMKSSNNQGAAVLQGILNLKSISDHPFLKSHDLLTMDINEVIHSSAKLIKTISIINAVKEVEEKVIVFTDNKKMQRVLRRVLLELYNLHVAIINGDTPSSTSGAKNAKLSRQQEVDKFQNQSGFNVIVMSPIAAGFGLNITGANHVIHYTRHWNPAKENQATDRAYRIGQTKPVHVYYPIAIAPNNELNTFDIILNKLLENKSKLASSTLFPSAQIEIKNDEFLNAFSLQKKTIEP
jgi:SNF2 family DNA or RNA helicase